MSICIILLNVHPPCFGPIPLSYLNHRKMSSNSPSYMTKQVFYSLMVWYNYRTVVYKNPNPSKCIMGVLLLHNILVGFVFLLEDQGL